MIQFNTLAGKLFARYKQDKVELDFPSFEVVEIPVNKDINSALGIKPIFIGTSGNRYIIEVENYQTLKSIQPDFAKLKALGRAFAVTCISDNPDYDFYSRFFALAVGINEDPVTGSSHTSLAPYWSKKLGKNKLIGHQASKRGGLLECELAPNGRVFIRGYARTVFEIYMRED
jgi:predicted PhzF superfamily epimerase YddE/YHI9